MRICAKLFILFLFLLCGSIWNIMWCACLFVDKAREYCFFVSYAFAVLCFFCIFVPFYWIFQFASIDELLQRSSHIFYEVCAHFRMSFARFSIKICRFRYLFMCLCWIKQLIETSTSITLYTNRFCVKLYIFQLVLRRYVNLLLIYIYYFVFISSWFWQCAVQ